MISPHSLAALFQSLVFPVLQVIPDLRAAFPAAHRAAHAPSPLPATWDRAAARGPPAVAR